MTPPPAGKHVWVRVDADERAGLLVAWEHRGGWWGRVVVATAGQAEEWLVEADKLRPV